ncbi:MAG: peptide ABC transporter permease [Candidatus Tectimicrobiota bacterium]|nr:MAG: peptide ABC transporter permease [Candidatus Tectomicrobia bacterium]
MARAEQLPLTMTPSPEPRRLALLWRRAPFLPLLIILAFIGSALLADLLTPHSPTKVSLPKRLRPPAWVEGGSWTHPLGTDPLGRDVLARLVYGARVSLLVAALTLALGGGVGLGIGLLAGYHGGRLDSVLMRAADITMAFPIILFAILLVAMLGGGLFNVVVSIALVLWARYARVIRGEVLSLMQRDFIARARVNGCSPLRLIVVHLLPNVLNTLMVLLSLQVGWLIIVESSLSFLGAGIPPPTPSWGSMIAEGRDYLTRAWWVSLFPGLAIMLTVLAFNLFGDWLRDRLDPRQRQV